MANHTITIGAAPIRVNVSAAQGPGGVSGSSTFAGLTDKASADLPAINTPLATALGLLAPKASPTFTGTVTIPSGAAIDGYLTTATASSTYAKLSGGNSTSGTQTFSGSILGNDISATTLAASASIAGGSISGTTGTFSGALSATTVTASGAGSFASGTFGNGSADSFLYGPNLRVVANSSGAIIMGSTATLVWSESTPTAAKDIRVRRSAAKTLTVDDNAGGSVTLAVTGSLTASGTVTATGGILPGTFTVGTFPTTERLMAVVTDALAPVAGAAVAAGGSAKALVMYAGSTKTVISPLP